MNITQTGPTNKQTKTSFLATCFHRIACPSCFHFAKKNGTHLLHGFFLATEKVCMASVDGSGEPCSQVLP